MAKKKNLTMDYSVTETVELGYDNPGSNTIGGTIKLTIKYRTHLHGFLNSLRKGNLLSLLDYFDHCTISRDEKVKDWSKRYFYIEEKSDLDNFFVDIFMCLVYLIDAHFGMTGKVEKELEDLMFEVQCGKEKASMDYSTAKLIYPDFKIEVSQ